MQFELTPEYLDLLKEAIEVDDKDFVQDELTRLHAHDLSTIFNELSLDEVKYLYKHIEDEEEAAKVLIDMEEDKREVLLSSLTSKEIAEQFINNMDTDDAADIIAELPEAKKDEVLSHMEDEEHASDIVGLLNYDENSAGGLMGTELLSAYETDSVFHCIRQVREKAEEIENIYTIYVVNKDNQLLGILPLKKLLITPLRTLVRDVYETDCHYVNTEMPGEDVARMMEKYDLVALPVVDHEKKLVGRITIDDVVDVIRDEETEDAQKMAGMEALDEPYMSMTVFEILKKRVGWLVILFVGESLTATAMGFFEDQIAKAVVLALFVPLIISSGGNTGSQVSTLVIRSLALGEVNVREWWLIVKKELKVGFLLGLTLGVFGFLRVAVWSMFLDIYGPNWMLIALTVGSSLVGVVLWGNLIGSLFPLILKRAGLDPAVSSAPFVATIVDVTGLVIYFTVASILLSGVIA